MEFLVVVLLVAGVAGALFKLVRDPDDDRPATLEPGRSHLRGDGPRRRQGGGWVS